MSPNDTVSRRSFLKAAGGATAAATFADTASGVGSAMAQGTQRGGLLTYARGSDSGTLDPQNTTSGEDTKVTNQVYDTLIAFKPGKTSLTQGLATDWSLKGTTTTLKLRKGVTFQNGETFTADDVIATYRRFTDSSYQYYPGDSYVSSYGPFTLGDWVKDMKKDGMYNVTIRLKQKYAPFLRNLAMFAASILSEAAMKKYGKKLNTNPVGTGAFAFDSWDQSNERIQLSAYDDYWGEGPKVDRVVFTAIASNTTRAQTLDSGDADIIDGLDAQSAQIVEQSGSAKLEQKEGINVGYMAFNMAKVKPFRDKRVRQAISYAINTKAIVNVIFKGIAEQASQPIPSNVLGYNEKLSPYPYNPDKARSMLKDAGYGGGFSFELATFQNPRPYNPSPIQAAQVVQSNLNDVGLDVTINQQTFNPFLEYTSSGKHDACFLGWITDNADPDNFYYALLDPGIPISKVPKGQDWVSFDTKNFNTLDVAAWLNTDFMKLARNAQRTYDDKQRAKLYRQAGKIAHDEAPWVFMDHAKELRGVGNNVEGYVVELISGPFLNLVSLKG